jgi:hypothetical protein
MVQLGRFMTRSPRHTGAHAPAQTMPVVALLFLVSFLNALYVFTRIKTYHLHSRPDPVASPNASFVPVALDRAPPAPPALSARIRAGAWALALASWRWLFALAPSRAPSAAGARRVQQLDVWAPGELELALLAVYGPAHALLWSAATAENWILVGLAMGAAGVQTRALTAAYERLLRDRAIIAAEVMHEYDTKVRTAVGVRRALVLMGLCSLCTRGSTRFARMRR